MLECQECGDKATYVLMDYYHEVGEDEELFCDEHAYDDGRESCSICENFEKVTEVEDSNGKIHLLKRTYQEGQIDSEGCCSDHP